jgi:hypothetical protein
MQLRTSTRHSKSPVGFMEYETVAFKWKSILDMHNAEQYAAKKAIAAVAQEPEAALCAAGSADAAALARPTNSSGNEDAAAADDTAAKREAARTVEANAVIVVEPDNGIDLRNKLLSSTAGKAMGQHGCGKGPH